ncbi:MAG: hypothetical protein ACO29T_05360 [Steroidobacteraceae bacterium]
MNDKTANVAAATANASVCGGVLGCMVGAMLLCGAARAAEPPAKLDLRLGDLRRFVDPADLYTPLPRDLDEIIIRSRPLPADIPEQRILPKGLGGLWWGAKNPTQAWRLLAPDPNEVLRPRNPDDLKEPPGAYRTRLGEPGRIF